MTELRPEQAGRVTRRVGGTPIPEWLARGTLIALFGLVAATTIRVPQSAGVSLDESWQVILAQAWTHQARFGVDILYTFGPLGVLENFGQLPQVFGAQVIWQIASRASFVLLLAALDGRWIASTHPAFTLARIETIDSRIPDGDDSICLAWLLRNCQVLGPEDGFAWLKSRSEISATKLDKPSRARRMGGQAACAFWDRRTYMNDRFPWSFLIYSPGKQWIFCLPQPFPSAV